MSALPPKADIGTGLYHLRRSNSGSFATFTAIRRAPLSRHVIFRQRANHGDEMAARQLQISC
jgi:hypothetical protein